MQGLLKQLQALDMRRPPFARAIETAAGTGHEEPIETAAGTGHEEPIETATGTGHEETTISKGY